MSTQRPLGPIGHCSARLRRALAIEEEEALGRAVRVRKPAKDKAADRTVRGNRWSRPANFAVPGAFNSRFVSTEGKVTFHFALQAVSKTSDGGCRITTPEGSKRLAFGAPGEHDAYIDRPGAVEITIAPAAFDGYAARTSATEIIEGERAIFTNISESADERLRYWRAVHEHERTPGSNRLTLVPETAPPPAWQRLADSPDMPAPVRDVAQAFATSEGKRKTRRIDLDALMLDVKEARELVRRIAEVLGTAKGKAAVRLSEGRGGRSQYRLTAEFPDGMDAAGRRGVTENLCAYMDEVGFMYTAAIHAPDHHNDSRNHHLHVAFHDRPAKMIGDRWDFEITEPVKGQHKRVRHPLRQKKIGDFSRDPDGNGRHAHGTETLNEMRTHFAELCNEQLDRLGVARKLHPGDLRSLGCDRSAQKPLGTRAAPLEAAGVPTSTGIRNAEMLWTALLCEAWTAAEERAKKSAGLRRHLVEVEQQAAAGSVIQQALAVEARDLIARLDAAEAVLGKHDGERAEYDVTLAMARARPNKVLDTCRQIVAAIDAGETSAAEHRARPAIVARAGEAEAFLAKIAAIDRDNAPALTPHRTTLAAAQADVDAISTIAATLSERCARARMVQSAKPDGRATLEALFERIMANDMPILLPDREGGGYRVPDITRAELSAITAPALAETAQKRLAALANLQAKRMVAAAGLVADLGLDGVERAAAKGDSGAARTLKHARAYADHQVYRRALTDAQAARTPVDSAAPTRGRGWTAGLRDQIASLIGRTIPKSDPEPATSPMAAVQPKVAPRVTRDDAITALAAALLTEPALRVVEGEHGLAIDVTDAPHWGLSVTAFADAPAVRAATLQRHRSPWLDVPAADRDRLLVDLFTALEAVDRRPLVETEGQWHVNLADERLLDIITRWHGYDALADVLVRADRHWHARETYAVGPTSISGSRSFAGDCGRRTNRERDHTRERTVPPPGMTPASPRRGGDLGR